MSDATVSVIIPVFNEEESITELYNELVAVRKSYFPDMEIVFVDDGSHDNSGALLKDIALKDKQTVFVAFNKNYGQTTALAAGIHNCQGNVIITIDADLQNDPHDIPKLMDELGKGFDVVSGWRKNRKDDYLKRILPSRIANWCISTITGLKIHDFGCTLKAYKREFLEDLTLYGEMHRFLVAYCSWNGAKVTEVEVNHRHRKYGISKYGIGRTFKVILDLIVVKFVLSYFTKPINVFGGIGAFAFLIGAAINAYVLIRKIFLQGQWMSPLFFTGMLLCALSIICFLLGFLAEILVRLYFESRENKFYKMKNKINA